MATIQRRKLYSIGYLRATRPGISLLAFPGQKSEQQFTQILWFTRERLELEFVRASTQKGILQVVGGETTRGTM